MRTERSGPRRRRLLTPLVAAILGGYLAFSLPSPVAAAAFTVNSAADAPDASPGDGICATGESECTLRAAIIEANTLPGADTITVPSGAYVIRTDIGLGENASDLGDLDITDDVEIIGWGADQTFIDGGIFVNSGIHEATLEVRSGSVVLSDLTIQNGGDFFGLPGGGIRNFASLSLSGVVVRDNIGNAAGILNTRTGALSINSSVFVHNHGLGGQSSAGAILNLGAATLNEVVFRGNVAAFGGGILNFGSLEGNNLTIEEGGSSSKGGGILNVSEMTLSDSSISGNVALFDGGGGIYNDGNLILTNSTISGNSAGPFGFGGAGIHNRGGASLLNVTITGNNASGEGDNSGGIYSDELNFPTAGLTLRNTIVAGNPGGDCGGPMAVVSGGHNLVSDGTCALNRPDDLQNTDPLLGPLADNGGPTETHALAPSSPAIDAGDSNACPSTDQRGFFRPVDGDGDGRAVCDIGAYEYGSHACEGDVNGDGVVDASDLRLVAGSIHSEPGSSGWNAAADVNADGVVDSADLRMVLQMRKTGACG